MKTIQVQHSAEYSNCETYFLMTGLKLTLLNTYNGRRQNDEMKLAVEVGIKYRISVLCTHLSTQSTLVLSVPNLV